MKKFKSPKAPIMVKYHVLDINMFKKNEFSVENFEKLLRKKRKLNRLLKKGKIIKYTNYND